MRGHKKCWQDRIGIIVKLQTWMDLICGVSSFQANRGKTVCEGHTINNLIIILKKYCLKMVLVFSLQNPEHCKPSAACIICRHRTTLIVLVSK